MIFFSTRYTWGYVCYFYDSRMTLIVHIPTPKKRWPLSFEGCGGYSYIIAYLTSGKGVNTLSIHSIIITVGPLSCLSLHRAFISFIHLKGNILCVR